MSVLIKDAKVPKSCAECDFIEYDDEYEFECWCPILRINVEEYTAEKYAGCPLVEIPPHGRLIDAAKVMADANYDLTILESLKAPKMPTYDRHKLLDRIDVLRGYLHRLADAPTVIDGEEQENGK